MYYLWDIGGFTCGTGCTVLCQSRKMLKFCLIFHVIFYVDVIILEVKAWNDSFQRAKDVNLQQAYEMCFSRQITLFESTFS